MTTPSRYQELLDKVDNKSAEFQERYGAALLCRKGCSSCCLPGLSVFSVERRAIRGWLLANPELLTTLRQDAETANPNACPFLDSGGACRIYPVRPIICRSQGLPLSFKVDERAKRDVCPLNLQDIELFSLPTEGLLNLDLLNTLLVLVDQVEGGEEAGQRFALELEAILGSDAPV